MEILQKRGDSNLAEGKITILIPQYIKNFKCIGSSCEDNCCIGWRVPVDQKSYKQYKKCSDRKMQQLLEENMKRIRDEASKYNYAEFKLKSDSSCPFLSENKLCTLQIKLGEKALCCTCRNYPRIFNMVNGIIEKSATLSCPQAARVALLDKNVMEFEEIEDEYDEHIVLSKKIETSNDASDIFIKCFWEIRIFTIDTLQNRDLRLWERLVILGMFFSKAAEKKDNIIDLINYYNSIMKDKSITDSFNNIEGNDALQLLLLNAIINERAAYGINSIRYTECITDFLSGLSYRENINNEELIDNYSKLRKNFYDDFIAEYEYILENYLVNYVFKNMFPMGYNVDIFESYLMLVIHYSLIKTIAAGMSGYYKKEMGEGHLLKLIQSLSKANEHNNKFLTHIKNLLKENGYSTLAYMVILLR